MLSAEEGWGVLATALAVAGYGPYIVSFVKKQVTPHAFSWLLWGLASFVIFMGQKHGGAGPGAWMALANGVMATGVAVLAWRYGERGIKRVDWAAMLLGLAGLAAWVLTNDIIAALLIMALVDLMAFAPTIRKSWFRPEQEDLSQYVLNTLALFCALLALSDFNFLSAFNILFFIAIQCGFIVMALWRRSVLARLYGQFCPLPQSSV